MHMNRHRWYARILPPGKAMAAASLVAAGSNQLVLARFVALAA